MRKILKKYGNATVILINAEDRKIYSLEEGDIVELTITKVEKE